MSDRSVARARAVVFIIAPIIGIIGAVFLVIGINVGGAPLALGIALIMLAIILGCIGALIRSY